MRIPPHRAGRRLLSLTLVAAVTVSVGGCARNRNRGDLPYVARDVGTLYTAAKTRLDQGSYKEAAALFDEVERQHPYSIWARRSQLMGAYSYYLDRDYTKSIESAQRFLSIHPGNRDAPYAYYLIALGYYEQINDVTRDQKITRQAQEALGELIRRYPTTRYASDARLKLDLVQDHLAGKEMEVGRFYEVRGQWLAGALRFRTVIAQYQTTTHVPEALMRLVECYLALGTPEEARKAAAVLGRNYPGSTWYARAFKLVGEHQEPAYALVTPGTPTVTPGSHTSYPAGEGGAPPRAEAPGAPTPATPAGGAGATPNGTGTSGTSTAPGTGGAANLPGSATPS